MKNNKKIGILSGLLVLTMILGFSGVASAKNRDGGDDDDRGKSSESKAFRTPHSLGSTLEVHFYDNGKVLVRGAQVTSISGTTINASVVWGSVTLPWAINTTGAEFITKHGGKSSVSETQVGDYVSFSGTLQTTTSSPFTVNAVTIKNWSKTQTSNQKTTIEGKIKTMTSTTVPGTFVITSSEKDYTVKVATDTSVLNTLWLKTSLTNYKVGDKIRVHGTINADATIDATVVRNTSI